MNIIIFLHVCVIVWFFCKIWYDHKLTELDESWTEKHENLELKYHTERVLSGRGLKEVLLFQPNENLNAEKVKTRRKALARAFHPDVGYEVNTALMQRINEAADKLERISK